MVEMYFVRKAAANYHYSLTQNLNVSVHKRMIQVALGGERNGIYFEKILPHAKF